MQDVPRLLQRLSDAQMHPEIKCFKAMVTSLQQLLVLRGFFRQLCPKVDAPAPVGPLHSLSHKFKSLFSDTARISPEAARPVRIPDMPLMFPNYICLRSHQIDYLTPPMVRRKAMGPAASRGGRPQRSATPFGAVSQSVTRQGPVLPPAWI